MEPMLIRQKPFDGAETIEIYPRVEGEYYCHYPIFMDGKTYVVAKDENEDWIADGLTENISNYIGELIEGHAL